MKVGVTFHADQNSDVFSNGIRQNALHFYMFLQSLGFDTYLITMPEMINDILSIPFAIDYQFCFFKDIVDSKFDIVFQFTAQIPTDILRDLKNTSTKVVLYKCGNDYVMDLEDALYSPRDLRIPQYSYTSEKLFDEIWTIPQHVNTNYHYWKTLFRCDVQVVPPIWSPFFIEDREEEFLWKKKGNNVAIFEPNINIVKWFFPALLVCENSYRKTKSIEHVFITNLSKKNKSLNLEFINSIVKPLDLFIDGKISIEDRFRTLDFMKKYADFVVSHQWENPLNYLYLDLAWMGWPILHNASFCRDVGYYYDGFDYTSGGDILSRVISDHEFNSGYLDKNRKAIDRYLPSNKGLKSEYLKLIEKLKK